MARIRSVKPDFWTSEQVMECSPIARLLFIGMWNFADDHGRIPCAPKTIKAQIFPADEMNAKNIRRMIDELASNGLVRLYEVGGKEFLLITGWHHQKIDKRQAAKYPDPPSEYSSNAHRTVSTDLRGSEGIGRDRIENNPPLRVDDDWPKDFGDQFWQTYPRKAEKLSTMKKLATLRKSGIVTFAELLAGAKRYAAANIHTEPKFVKQPTTWLNAGCWADEIQTGGSDGNRTGNTRTSGHDAILTVATRKARELDRQDPMAGTAGAPGFATGDGADGEGPGGDRNSAQADHEDHHRDEPDDQRVREGQIVSADKNAAGLPGGRELV
jgi:hypothetical protein